MARWLTFCMPVPTFVTIDGLGSEPMYHAYTSVQITTGPDGFVPFSFFKDLALRLVFPSPYRRVYRPI